MRRRALVSDTASDMRWCGRKLSEMTREELENALWQCYSMYVDLATPERFAERAKEKIAELKRERP
jgi:hypothetical protein